VPHAIGQDQHRLVGSDLAEHPLDIRLPRPDLRLRGIGDRRRRHLVAHRDAQGLAGAPEVLEGFAAEARLRAD
jgi:hypothetical protein